MKENRGMNRRKYDAAPRNDFKAFTSVGFGIFTILATLSGLSLVFFLLMRTPMCCFPYGRGNTSFVSWRFEWNFRVQFLI